MYNKRNEELKHLGEFFWDTRWDMDHCSVCAKMTQHKITFYEGHLYDKKCMECKIYINYEAELKANGWM